MKTGRIIGGIVALVMAAAALPAVAQTYPDRPIRLIIPYTPGGALDYVGRQIAQYLGESIGQPVVAENRAGAGGMVGTEVVARAPADGYQMAIMDPAIVINPTLQPHVPYDLFKQLQTVSVIVSSPEVLVVTPGLPVKTFDEFVAYAKAHPGELNFASAGVGTTPHLAAEMFKQRTGIVATHVPYKGIGASYTDMMDGKVQFAFSSIAGALPFTQDNRVRPLATTGLKRSAVYPDLPTVDEAGLKGYTVDLWLGLFTGAGTPPAVMARLNGEVRKVLKDPNLIKALAKFGIEATGTTPEEGDAFVRSEFDRWKSVITDANIKIN